MLKKGYDRMFAITYNAKLIVSDEFTIPSTYSLFLTKTFLILMFRYKPTRLFRRNCPALLCK